MRRRRPTGRPASASVLAGTLLLAVAAPRYDAIAGGELRLRALEYHAGETAAWIVGAYG